MLMKICNKLRPVDYFVIPTIIIVGIILSVLSLLIFSNIKAARDTPLYTFSQIFTIASISGTITCLMYFLFSLLKLKLNKLLLLILHVVSFGPFLVIIVQIFQSQINYNTIIFEIGIGLLLNWSLIIRHLSQISSKSSYINIGIPVFVCTLFPLFIVGVPIYTLLSSKNIDTSIFVQLGRLEAFFIVALITLSYLGVYIYYFQVRDSDLENEDQLFKKLGKWNSLPGIVIFIFFLSICLYCIINILQAIEDRKVTSDLYLNIIFLGGTPIMMILGIIISRLNYDYALKLNIFTVLFGLIPMILFLALYLIFTDYQDILKYFLVLPLFFTLFWSSLSIITKPLKYNWLLMFSCVFIAFPVGFLLPFGLSNNFLITPVYIVLGIFLSIPTTYFFYMLYLRLKEFFAKERYEKKEIIRKSTFYNTTSFVITCLFIISEATLLYMCFTSKSPNATGAIISMLVLIMIFYILTSITMQIKLSRSRNLILSLVILVIFLNTSIIFAVLSYFLSSMGSEVYIACVSSCVSSILTMIIAIIFLQIKYQNKNYSKLLMVICNLILWIFIILPLGVALPSALSRATDDRSKNKIIGIATVFLGLVFMLGVSISSIIFNIYQQKLENEKFANECSKQICKELKRKLIYNDYHTIKKFYDRYSFYNFDQINFSAIISDQSYFKLLDQSIKKNYSKEYLSADQNSKPEKKDEKPKPNFWELLNCFGIHESIQIDTDDQEIIPEEKEQILAENDLKIVSLDQLDAVTRDELAKLKPSGRYQDNLYSFHKMPDQHYSKAVHGLEMFVKDKELLKNDKTKRKEFLSFIFLYLSHEPNDYILEQWMSETNFLLLARYGGINSDLISDKRLKIAYYLVTLQEKLVPLTKKIFINEAIPTLAEMLFPNIDVVKRETVLIVDFLFMNLLENFKMLLQETSDQKLTSEKNDPLLVNLVLKKSNEISCSDRTNSDYFYIKMVGSETHRSSIPILSDSSSELSDFKPNKLHNFFLEIGTKISNLFIKLASSIELKLRSFYLSGNNKKDQKDLNQKEEKELPEVLITFSDVNEFIIKTIDLKRKQKTEAEKINSNAKINFKSFSNLMTILSRVLEFLQLSAIGFNKNINWNFFQEPLAATSNVLLIENNPFFLPIFWTCFVFAGIYIPLAWRAKNEILENKFGRDKDGSKGKKLSLTGLKKYSIIILGSQLYMYILKSQLAVFACDWSLDPPILFSTDIVCYESLHLIHFFFALVCIVIYYPLATFIFPMFQFNDASLDIKFDTTFMIFLSQAKLMIIGITVFLPYIQYQVGFASFTLFVLFLYVAKKKPCLAPKFNIWLAAGYFAAFSTNFMAFINIELGGSILVNLVFFILVGLTLVGAIVLHVYSLRLNKVKPR